MGHDHSLMERLPFLEQERVIHIAAVAAFLAGDMSLKAWREQPAVAAKIPFCRSTVSALPCDGRTPRDRGIVLPPSNPQNAQGVGLHRHGAPRSQPPRASCFQAFCFRSRWTRRVQDMARLHSVYLADWLHSGGETDRISWIYPFCRSVKLTSLHCRRRTIPAPGTMIASYLAEYAETLSVATLVRRMATISKAHTARGPPSSTASELLKATMRGIKREPSNSPG
ncbi:hypothetical protein ABIA20_005135 [Sinorhizobium fredii]